MNKNGGKRIKMSLYTVGTLFRKGRNLNRWPVLKARNICYQVLTFDRKDSL